jgi:fructan beta-fructosidase
MLYRSCPLFASLLLVATFSRADDILIADFESDNYGGWQVTGTAFGNSPAEGTLPGQMPVSGFQGKRLVNSYSGGDAATGTLTSPEFKLQRRYVTFLIGGGGHAGQTCLNLLVDGEVVRTAAGPNTVAGGSEALEPASWDVGELMGRRAQLQIVDNATGGWGHVNVDQIVLTDTKPDTLVADAARELTAERRWLHLPVETGAKPKQVTVEVDGRPERTFTIELADTDADWWAPLDISAWKGQRLKVRVDRLRENSTALTSITQDDEIKETGEPYGESLRPRFHFSAHRGWLNDPNGLVFFEGEYHLFFQHNPYGWAWGNMHWGHAVSRDLVHWRELGEALYPDRFGPMFSGSAVVDWKNRSGFGTGDRPPLVLLYTAAGDPTVQCLAYSTDRGRTFTKYADNPVVRQLTPGNRDPKVIWHEPSNRWVIVLYVQRGETPTIEFLTSPDLKTWTSQSASEPFFECPDLIELPVDGDAAKKVWVLTAANAEYMLGTFDGARFTSVSGKDKFPGHAGRGFYAAQTFSDLPADDGRRIQIGWLQAPSPGMSFNQSMSVPQELSLRTTADGVRLARRPVRELATLRGETHRLGPMKLTPGDDPLSKLRASAALEVHLAFTAGDADTISLSLRGVPIVYDRANAALSVAGQKPVPLNGGPEELTVLLDTTSIEVFAEEGLVYVPVPVIPARDNFTLSLTADGGTAQITALEIHELRSAWSK